MRVAKILLLSLVWWVFLAGFPCAGGDSCEQEASREAQRLTQKVYEAYAAEKFEDVYQWMAPEIQEVMTQEQYEEYQQHHFERLRLVLTDIEVSDSSTAQRPPRGLRARIADGYDLYFTVQVQYTASFRALGSQRSETMDKTVYWAAACEEPNQVSLYLLWDPSDVLEEGAEQ